MTELLVVIALVLGAVMLVQRAVRWVFAILQRRKVREPFTPRPFSDAEMRRARQLPPPVEPELSIEYVDGSIVMQRDIARLAPSPYNRNHFRAWCFTSGAERTFRHNRIRSAIELRTGREIRDLKRYLAEY